MFPVYFFAFFLFFQFLVVAKKKLTSSIRIEQLRDYLNSTNHHMIVCLNLFSSSMISQGFHHQVLIILIGPHGKHQLTNKKRTVKSVLRWQTFKKNTVELRTSSFLWNLLKRISIDTFIILLPHVYYFPPIRKWCAPNVFVIS